MTTSSWEPAEVVEVDPVGGRSFFGWDIEPWWVRWVDAARVTNSIFGRGFRWMGRREPAGPRCVLAASEWVARELAADTRGMRVPWVARPDLKGKKGSTMVQNEMIVRH